MNARFFAWPLNLALRTLSLDWIELVAPALIYASSLVQAPLLDCDALASLSASEPTDKS